VFTSLYFQTFWPKCLSCFGYFKNISVYAQKMTITKTDSRFLHHHNASSTSTSFAFALKQSLVTPLLYYKQSLHSIHVKSTFRQWRNRLLTNAKKQCFGTFSSEATPGQTRHSGSTPHLYQGHWQNATVRGLHHWNFHLLLFWLALSLL